MMEHQVNELINSGIIELYVMGFATEEQKSRLLKFALDYPEVQKAMDDFAAGMQTYITSKAVEPSVKLKPMLMATIDYQERLKKGESIELPPLLHENSLVTEYSKWLQRPDMQLPPNPDDIYAKIIGTAPGVLMAIIWIKEGTPEEIHETELESFLILEGTCVITIGNEHHLLSVGDYLAIPLHKPHHVSIISSIRCKAILQRIAA